MTTLTLRQCKRRLASLWFSASLGVFVLVLIQSVLGHYGDDVSRAWGWLLPSLLPTLSLIAGVIVADIGTAPASPSSVDRFTFRLSLSVSAAYLFTIVATLLLQPFATAAGDAVDFLATSNLWLAPLQGLASATISAFFAKTKGS